MTDRRIISLEPLEDFSLFLAFNDGTIKKFDVTPYIKGSWFGQLGDWEYFKQVKLIRNGIGVQWPDGQDIAPHELLE